ncbi:ER membrane glycoprotein subunit of the GPI transamidase complex-like protein [Basidiobolus ranarum]|uniref:GPI mannosyltransferase 2 n=1 Tax=Basidiobolus ranarum TaxID=34480 RepID=A0ABR2W2V4_9FUNG
MAGIFTLRRTPDDSMDLNLERKKASRFKDSLVKPQTIKLSQVPTKSSLFALLFKKKNVSLFSLFALAILSRFVVWIIAVSSNYFIEDYDSSVDMILPNTSTNNFLQAAMRRAMAAFVRWDAFYFVHIAEEGYIYEQEYAFFPMLPLLMRGLSATVLRPFQVFFDPKILLILSGIIVSTLSFSLATVALYHLSYSIFKKERFALITALCYCFTPSCMFMSSMYTESLFSLLTFVGMDLYVHKQFWCAAVVWSLSSLTRSNGIVYAGFFIFDLCIKNRSKSPMIYMAQVMKATALSVITILGMASFQMYGYFNYCLNQTNPRPWCDAKVPLIYSFVQAEYWNCGLFKYYEWKQIPNFLLAAPMMILSIYGIWSYAAHDWTRFFSLGISSAPTKDIASSKQRVPKVNGISCLKKTTHDHILNSVNSRPVMISPVRHVTTNSSRIATNTTNKASLENLFYTETLLPFIYLWGVLLVYCTLNMHIQVITRFFSCMPTVYWFAAHVLIQATESSKQKAIVSRSVLFYFITYGLTGIVLFSNFFPPA